MNALILAVVLAASFPLPAVDGKPLAVQKDQTTFRLPMRFERVKKFYAEQFAGNAAVQMKEQRVDGRRVLTLAVKSKGESWQRAVVRDNETETVIVVTPVMRFDEQQISGSATPLVQFVFGRSPEIQKAVERIDHTESMRAK